MHFAYLKAFPCRTGRTVSKLLTPLQSQRVQLLKIDSISLAHRMLRHMPATEIAGLALNVGFILTAAKLPPNVTCQVATSNRSASLTESIESPNLKVTVPESRLQRSFCLPSTIMNWSRLWLACDTLLK